MKSRRQDFVLGVAVLAFIGLFVGTILFVYPSMAGETRRISVRFQHDQGVAPLKEGSAVMLSGALPVGKVVDVRKERATIETPAGAQERLLIVVDADIEADLALYRDCRVTTDQPPVGGSGVLVILAVGTPQTGEVAGPIAGLPPQSLAAAIGTLSRRVLGPNGLIDKVEEMLDIHAEGSLASKVGQSLDDINAMTEGLRVQLNPHEQMTLMSKIHLIVDDLNETTASLRMQLAEDDEAALIAKVHGVLDRLDSGLAEANAMLRENRPAIRNSMASVESIARTMDEELVVAMKAEFDRDDPTSLLGKIHSAMDQLNVSLDNVATMSNTGRELVLMNRPALQRTIENMKDVSDQLRVGVQEILLAPWRLLKPPPREMKRLDVFEAARRFAEAATMLDDAAARLEAIQNATGDQPSTGSAEEIEKIREGLQAAFERFRTAEQFLWEQMK